MFSSYERNRLLERVSSFLMPRKGERVALDIAGGDGVVSTFLGGIGWRMTTFDISITAARRARARGIGDVLLADVEVGLPFRSSTFDMVFWGDNVEHLRYPLEVLKDIRRVLCDSGTLVMSTPNIGWLPFRFYHLATGMICRSEGHQNPPWSWEHIRFFNLRVLRDFLWTGGFELQHIWGCDRRTLFDYLSRISPSMFGSILVLSAKKVIADEKERTTGGKWSRT